MHVYMCVYAVLEIAAAHWTFSAFGRPKSILVGQIYCTLLTGQQSKTYKMSNFQENG